MALIRAFRYLLSSFVNKEKKMAEVNISFVCSKMLSFIGRKIRRTGSFRMLYRKWNIVDSRKITSVLVNIFFISFT